MRFFKLIIEYDGADFSGWQLQNHRYRTVQGEIERALKQIFKKRIRIIGSGRTDAGVHAKGQVAGFAVRTRLQCQDIQKALNFYLPEDLVIHHVIETEANFHARYSVKSKIYKYVILNQKTRSPLERHRCWQIPRPLNLGLMRQAAKIIKGKHNFRGFMSANSVENDSILRNTVRTVTKLNIKKQGAKIIVEIEADGFLYKMVRNIVGTLVQVGLKKMNQKLISKIYKEKTRMLVPAPAPAFGLYLWCVKY
jgi:tRNA pseudouridine38-40 synthase